MTSVRHRIPTGSPPRPSGSAGSCWRTATAWSARRTTPRTWCRRPICGRGGPIAGFEGRASIRSWLYTIATNVCLTALQRARSGCCPRGWPARTTDPIGPPRPVAPDEVAWLEPLPDAWIAPPADDPAAVVVARESVRLALIAGLQHLPARQRAILILRDVLAFSAAETAEILDTTTAAVKSGLQRARARLDELEPEPDGTARTDRPTGPRAARRATSRPSSAPMPGCWSRCCAPTPRWRRRRSVTGSRAGRCASTCSTRTCWATRATGG